MIEWDGHLPARKATPFPGLGQPEKAICRHRAVAALFELLRGVKDIDVCAQIARCRWGARDPGVRKPYLIADWPCCRLRACACPRVQVPNCANASYFLVDRLTA